MRRPNHPLRIAGETRAADTADTGTAEPVQASRRRRRRRLLGVVGGVVALGLILTAVVAVAQLQGNVTTAPIRSDLGAETDDAAPALDTGSLNILLLGSDARALSSDAFGDDDGTQRSDAMVLAHISADNTRIDAVQLPRDTLMDLPPCPDTGRGATRGGQGMLNSALNAGPACSVAAVERLTGVHVDHFVQMDFEGFIGMVDAMGGIDVCLPEPLQDPHAMLDLPAGPQAVDGTQALALARTRHALAEESDIARLGHQQMVLSAIVQKATRSDVLVRPDRLYAFLDAATSSMTVDPDLGALSSLVGLAARVANVPLSDVTFLTMPWAPAPQDRNRVVPAADAAVVFQALRDDTPVVLTSDAVDATTEQPVSPDPGTVDTAPAVRSAPVLVANGAGVAGLAAQVAEEARGLGFGIRGLSNADATDVTVILAADDAEAQATARTLAADLGGDIEIRTEQVDGVRLVLGRDYPDRAAAVVVPARPVDAVSRSADIDLCTA